MWQGTEITKKVVDQKSTYTSYKIEVPKKGINMTLHAQDGSAVAVLIGLFEEATNELKGADDGVRPEQESQATDADAPR